MLQPIANFDTTIRFRAIMRSVVAYDPETHITLSHTHGHTSTGEARYLIRICSSSCPSVRAYTETEAIEKANRWLARNQHKYDISALPPLSSTPR